MAVHEILVFFISCHDLYNMCTLWHYLGSNLRGYLKFYFSFEFRKSRLRFRDEFTKAFVFLWSQRSDQAGAAEVPEQVRCVHIRSCLLCPDCAFEVNLPAACLVVFGFASGSSPRGCRLNLSMSFTQKLSFNGFSIHKARLELTRYKLPLKFM